MRATGIGDQDNRGDDKIGDRLIWKTMMAMGIKNLLAGTFHCWIYLPGITCIETPPSRTKEVKKAKAHQHSYDMGACSDKR